MQTLEKWSEVVWDWFKYALIVKISYIHKIEKNSISISWLNIEIFEITAHKDHPTSQLVR